MARAAVMRGVSGRDPRVVPMVGLSAVLHAAVLFVVLFVVPLVKPQPLPLVAYTVELTDPNALGGRLAPGRSDLPMGPRAGSSAPAEAPAKQGDPAVAPEPVSKAEPPAEPPKPIERAKAPEPPKPEEPAVKLPSPEKPPPPKPEAKKPPEPRPEAKVEPPKPEPKKLEPKKVEPKPEAKKPEPPKAEAKAAEAPPKPPAAAERKPAAEAKPVGKPNGKPEGAADGADAYAASAEKWRTKGATGGGGGLGGTDTASGPLGTPGYGAGGGQVVGFEFLAYQQRVVSTVKGVWTNAAPRPGLVAKVRFQIAPDGEVSGVRLEQASGDGVFDASVMRAVERANPLPPPPARYVSEFRDFMIEFHSEEGGQASG